MLARFLKFIFFIISCFCVSVYLTSPIKLHFYVFSYNSVTIRLNNLISGLTFRYFQSWVFIHYSTVFNWLNSGYRGLKWFFCYRLGTLRDHAAYVNWAYTYYTNLNLRGWGRWERNEKLKNVSEFVELRRQLKKDFFTTKLVKWNALHLLEDVRAIRKKRAEDYLRDVNDLICDESIVYDMDYDEWWWDWFL